MKKEKERKEKMKGKVIKQIGLKKRGFEEMKGKKKTERETNVVWKHCAAEQIQLQIDSKICLTHFPMKIHQSVFEVLCSMQTQQK